MILDIGTSPAPGGPPKEILGGCPLHSRFVAGEVWVVMIVFSPGLHYSVMVTNYRVEQIFSGVG